MKTVCLQRPNVTVVAHHVIKIIQGNAAQTYALGCTKEERLAITVHGDQDVLVIGTAC